MRRGGAFGSAPFPVIRFCLVLVTSRNACSLELSADADGPRSERPVTTGSSNTTKRFDITLEPGSTARRVSILRRCACELCTPRTNQIHERFFHFQDRLLAGLIPAHTEEEEEEVFITKR